MGQRQEQNLLVRELRQERNSHLAQATTLLLVAFVFSLHGATAQPRGSSHILGAQGVPRRVAERAFSCPFGQWEQEVHLRVTHRVFECRVTDRALSSVWTVGVAWII